jgi:apolipoprotein N-acyltransferase
MRSVPFADAKSAAGSDRVLFEADGAQIATTVGFESIFGDHVRQFTADGADLIVVLSRNDLWGRSAGLYQHLQFTRMRAIESRRTVVLSTVSGISALIHPSGEIEEIAGWMDQDVEPIQVPTYRAETFYVRHGDWLGHWALGLGLLYNLGALALTVFAPELVGVKKRGRRLASRPAY